MKKKVELQDMNSYKFQPNVCFGLERIDLVATQGQEYQVAPGLVVDKTDARNNMYNTYEQCSLFTSWGLQAQPDTMHMLLHLLQD